MLRELGVKIGSASEHGELLYVSTHGSTGGPRGGSGCCKSCHKWIVLGSSNFESFFLHLVDDLRCYVQIFILRNPVSNQYIEHVLVRFLSFGQAAVTKVFKNCQRRSR